MHLISSHSQYLTFSRFGRSIPLNLLKIYSSRSPRFPIAIILGQLTCFTPSDRSWKYCVMISPAPLSEKDSSLTAKLSQQRKDFPWTRQTVQGKRGSGEEVNSQPYLCRKAQKKISPSCFELPRANSSRSSTTMKHENRSARIILTILAMLCSWAFLGVRTRLFDSIWNQTASSSPLTIIQYSNSKGYLSIRSRILWQFSSMNFSERPALAKQNSSLAMLSSVTSVALLVKASSQARASLSLNLLKIAQ